jgi:ABC-type transporter Mla MlaB component
VLKITVEEKERLVTLKLEGKVTGPWVAEFSRTWQSLAPSLNSKKLSVDLREVTQISAEGRRLLAEIYNQTSAEFQTDSLLMELYAQEAMREHHKNDKRSTK